MGQFSNWSREEYDADTTRERSTRLKAIISPKGPRQYYLEHVNPPPRVDEDEPSSNEALQPKVDDKVKGTLLHDLVLRHRQDWVVCDARVGTNHWKEAVAEADGKWVIKSRDEAEILGWRDGLMREPAIRKALEAPGFNEHPILFEMDVYRTDGEVEQLPCKAAIDKFHLNGELEDLKTSSTVTRDQFLRQVYDLSYHFSAAFYERGRNSIDGFRGFGPPFWHIVVQKKWPYYAYRWELDRETYLAWGHAMVEQAAHRLCMCRAKHAECERLGVDPLAAWPDLEADPSPVSAPPWVADRYVDRFALEMS